MQIYFHSRLWSYLPRVPILVEGTGCMFAKDIRVMTNYFLTLEMYNYVYTHTHTHTHTERERGRETVQAFNLYDNKLFN